MTFHVVAESPPLTEDETGALRVGKSRVLLELVVHAFDNGSTPETITQQYASLELSDVYAVIAYYLRHRSEVAAYLAQRELQAESVRAKFDHHTFDLREIRARLAADPQN